MGVDITVGNNGLSVATSQRVLSTIPSTWEEMVATYGIGYNYPQPTGQTTIYRTGDDAWVEQNVFTPAVRASNSLKPRQSLADWETLNNNNAFGNTSRFTDIAGTAVTIDGNYDDEYIIDHYSGLGFYFGTNWDNTAAETWEQAIDTAAAFSNGGFNDFFMANLNQSLIWLNPSAALGLYLFNKLTLITTRQIKTSTSYNYASTKNWGIRNRETQSLYNQLKTDSSPYIICRKHY